MILWVAILVLTVVTVGAVLWPFLRPATKAGALDHAVAFYEERRAELARLEAEGQISGAERAGAEAEQARRLIALRKAEEAAAGSSGSDRTRRRKAAVLGVLIAMPLIAVGTYAMIGKPGLPDQPLASRQIDPQVAALASALRQIEAHLAQKPDDGRGHEVVAPVYMRLGRYEDAARSFRRVIELLGETPPRLADLGESLMAGANGTVTAEARTAFERSIVLDPSFTKSRFYLAMATEQDGQVAKAYADLVALASGLQPGEARERVMSEIQRFRSEGKVPVDAPLPTAPATGPQSAAGAGIAAMSEEDRNAAIRGMVEGLAARLAQSGGTFEEWYRLIQARLVLGERDKAAEHLAAAKKAFADDPAMVARFEGVGRAFSITEVKP